MHACINAVLFFKHMHASIFYTPYQASSDSSCKRRNMGGKQRQRVSSKGKKKNKKKHHKRTKKEYHKKDTIMSSSSDDSSSDDSNHSTSRSSSSSKSSDEEKAFNSVTSKLKSSGSVGSSSTKSLQVPDLSYDFRTLEVHCEALFPRIFEWPAEPF